MLKIILKNGKTSVFPFFFVILHFELTKATLFRNMKRSFLIGLLCIIASLTGATAASASKGWEQIKSEYSELKSIVKEPEIEILTGPSLVVVTSSKQVKIQIFTILGRLVSSETLPPGTSQLSLPAHGVYIVKVGELTCKIAI